MLPIPMATGRAPWGVDCAPNRPIWFFCPIWLFFFKAPARSCHMVHAIAPSSSALDRSAGDDPGAWEPRLLTYTFLCQCTMHRVRGDLELCLGVPWHPGLDLLTTVSM